jgi:TRAP-type mannitol/chloroaromatic compound transport system permease small subunit
MKNLLLAVDRASTWIGQAFAWMILLLTCLISWEVYSRYVLNNPHDWALDAQIMLYGTLFMMAGAYTLAKNGHVRGDVLYGFFEPRTQARIDLGHATAAVSLQVHYSPGRFHAAFARGGGDRSLHSVHSRRPMAFA